jgi:[ribosomal protein S5]-alanine N-acetyltransferase
MFRAETPRLILRDWLESDLPLIEALASDPNVTRYQTWLRLRDDDARRRWLETAIFHNQRDPRFAYSTAVVSRETRRAIGWLGWGRAEDPAHCETSFGYALLPAEWGYGYMTEAVLAMLRFVFETLGRSSICATCATSNRRSARVLEQTGLALVHRWTQRDDEMDSEEEHLRYRMDRTDCIRRTAPTDAVP